MILRNLLSDKQKKRFENPTFIGLTRVGRMNRIWGNPLHISNGGLLLGNISHMVIPKHLERCIIATFKAFITWRNFVKLLCICVIVFGLWQCDPCTGIWSNIFIADHFSNTVSQPTFSVPQLWLCTSLLGVTLHCISLPAWLINISWCLPSPWDTH